MRNQLWQLVRARVAEGQILPWWALAVRAVLFPLEFFYWRMSREIGYQWERDVWIINGVEYSAQSLRFLADAQGETYRIWRTGKTVTVTRVRDVAKIGL